MPATKLKRFLDEHGIAYQCIEHYPAYTAQETAAEAHIPGRDVAKTVMVTLDGELAMAVLPANRMLSPELLERATGVKRVELAPEVEFESRFPDCEPGAMPPFGNLYGLRVFVDESLTADEQIAFNAGTHRELVQMSYADFARLVSPAVGRYAYVRSTRMV